ncbi:MAG: methyltransferase domain-containing protein [Rhodobacteraceae bacterium]|nr:methyltransferase domain-containing protein [Paracoccaceae bacterium]
MIEYPVVNGQVVLVDFDESILSKGQVVKSGAASLIEGRRTRQSLLKRAVMGQNDVAARNAGIVLEHLRTREGESTILIVGGGSVNEGARELYLAESVRVISFDVYASPNTDFVADAHAIPLKDGSVDAVWIQAVLEHVLTPATVVDEIWRVLRPEGLVYAETPFLQPVHEAAYDFTRFTENGHRWLFRHFEMIDSGVVRGPGTVLFQILRYALGAAVGNRWLGSRLTLPFFWVRFLDRLADRAHASDTASSVFFIGRRSEKALRPQDMAALFRGVQK